MYYVYYNIIYSLSVMNSEYNQSKPIEIIRVKRITEVVQSPDQNIQRIRRTTEPVQIQIIKQHRIDTKSK